MRIHRDERGQTIILVALSLPIMLGFVGLATDVGSLLKDKRTIQTAADAAAIAGALNLNYGNTAITTAAQNAAAANGFTVGTGVTVVINNGPTWPSSNYLGKTGYIEATVTKSEPTIFLALFGQPSVTVLARAVATNSGPGTGCIYTTGAIGTTLTVNGTTLSVPGCGVLVDSNDPNAMVVNGSSVNLASIGVVGGVVNTGSTINPAPVTSVAPASDPLNYLPQFSFTSSGGGAPVFTASCAPNYTCSNSPIPVPTNCLSTGGGVYSVTAGATLNPGCYTTLNFPNAGSVTLSPGLYIVDGDVNFASGNVSGTGVTLYYSGQLVFGTGTYTLYAPNDTTQFFNGILFAESISDIDSFAFGGGAGTVLQGIVYAPGAFLNPHNNSPVTLNTSFVAQEITFDQPVAFTNYGSLPNVVSPLSSAVLVE